MDNVCLPAVAVVVLYRQAPMESMTLRSLAEACEAGFPMPGEILVFENEARRDHSDCELLARLSARYISNGDNLGIRGGYEAARQRASELGFDWLWLLDQDTVLPKAYFEVVAKALDEVGRNEDCAAICPLVESEGRVISPLGKFGQPAEGCVAILPPGSVTSAVNSGALVRRSFVDALGGFDARLWLDGLDHWLFLSLRARQRQVAVAGARLEHALSVLGTGSYVPVSRYRSILASERILYRELYSRGERARYLLRLVFRCVKHPLRYRSLDYLGPTLGQLAALVFNRREG